MTIPPNHADRFLYHFTHVENLKGVLANGFLCCNEQIRLQLKHRSIAAAGIQERRARMRVPCGPRGVVHDYVPLYFSKLSPMLLQVVRSKNVDQGFLVHFAFPISLLERSDVVFTNAAANTAIAPAFYEDPARLDELDWNAIERTKWGSDSDEQKHARMAEALVYKKLDPREAAYLIVWNQGIKEHVLSIYRKSGVTPPRIKFDGDDGLHFVTHFRKELPSDMRNASISVGPVWTKHRFLKVVKEIGEMAGALKPEFSTIFDLLKALQTKGLDTLQETRELIDLESENEVHKEDVGRHTLTVVKKLRESNEYQSLKGGARTLVELAAFLHDIGKGPKSRWTGCGGKQQVDNAHPIRSAEMLPRILTESVSKPDERTIRILCMLVCYHDLIGDIIGNGRDRKQLIGIVRDEEELDMLIALGKADMSSVARAWRSSADASIPELRAWAIERLDEAVEDEAADDDTSDENK